MRTQYCNLFAVLGEQSRDWVLEGRNDRVAARAEGDIGYLSCAA